MTYLRKHLNFPPDTFSSPLLVSSPFPVHYTQSWGSVQDALLLWPLFISCWGFFWVFFHGCSMEPCPGHHLLKSLVPSGNPCGQVSPAPSVSCLDWILLVGPLFLKLVARSYPKPNHSPSAVKNVLTWDSLSPAVTHGLICTLPMLLWAERGGKASWEHRKNRSLSPVPGHIPCSRSYPVRWGWRLLALAPQEKICGMVCGLSGCVWAMWVYDLQVLSAEPSHLCDVWNAVSWKLITFPKTSTHSWVRQKAEISVPEMELHDVRSLL